MRRALRNNSFWSRLAGAGPASADTSWKAHCDLSPDMMFVHRVEGPSSFPLESWNATAQRILKLGADAAGRPIQAFMHASNHTLVQGELAACCSQAEPRSFLLQAHPDRSHRSWQFSLVPVCDESGAVIRILGCARDVTELRAAEAAAQQAAAIKAEFLANISHEIRTPLNTIVGFSGLLCERALPAAEARYAQLVNSAGHALLAIVNDVLDFSKLEAGAVDLEPAPCDIDRLAHEVVELFEGEAAGRGLHVTLRLEGEALAPVLVDGGRLRQVLLNLVSNAVKFTEAGGVTLIVERAAQGEAASLAFQVVDTGIGIAPGKLGRLFQRFSQTDGGDARRYGGAGLGLAICRRLAEAMDAELTVESQVGEGSTFRLALTLPLADAPAAAEAPQGAGVRAARNILVVDDIDVNRELVAAFLKSTQHRLSEAANGAAAVEAVQAQAFDLVLMDIQMPGMTGVEATQAIRALGGAYAELPILAMTAKGLADQVETYMAAGMDGLLPKPLLKEALLAAIDRYAGGDQSAPALAAASPFEGMEPAQVQALLSMFDAQLAKRLISPDGDRDTIRADAHALAGSSGMVGFDALGEACRRLDEACRSGADYADALMLARREAAQARAEIAGKLAA